MGLSKGLVKDFLRFLLRFLAFFCRIPVFCPFLRLRENKSKNVAKNVDSFRESAKVRLS